MKRLILCVAVVMAVASPVSAQWNTPPFNAANFSGTLDMTWAVAPGNVLTNTYLIKDKKLTWNVVIGGSIIGGTPGLQLALTIPQGKTAKSVQGCTYWSYSTVNFVDVTYDVGLALIPAGNKLFLSRQNTNSNWPLGFTTIVLSCTFEIN